MPVSLRQIAETAAFASARAPFILDDQRPVSPEHVQNYWKCCRGRMLDWLRLLESTASDAGCSSSSDHEQLWRRVSPAIEEILVTEILTRVWATVLTAADLNRGSSETTPIARHTFNGHLDVRNRAVRLAMHELHLPMGELSRIDRLRRKAERWTDILIGHLALNFQVDEFAFEPQRAVEFGEGQLRDILRATDEPLWEFVMTGIRLAFSQQHNQPVSPAWHRGIVRSVLGSFPADSFDESGTFKSIRRVRIERGPAGSERVLDALNATRDTESRGVSRGQIRFAELRERFER